MDVVSLDISLRPYLPFTWSRTRLGKATRPCRVRGGRATPDIPPQHPSHAAGVLVVHRVTRALLLDVPYPPAACFLRAPTCGPRLIATEYRCS